MLSGMEKVVVSRTLGEFGQRENPWKHRSYEERLIAMAVICGTTQQYNQPFSRVWRIRHKGRIVRHGTM